MSDHGIDVSRLNETFGLTDSEREEFEGFIEVLEGVMARHGRDDTTEAVSALSPCRAGSQAIDSGPLMASPSVYSIAPVGGRVRGVGGLSH